MDNTSHPQNDLNNVQEWSNFIEFFNDYFYNNSQPSISDMSSYFFNEGLTSTSHIYSQYNSPKYIQDTDWDKEIEDIYDLYKNDVTITTSGYSI